MIEHAVISAFGQSHHRSALIHNRPRAMLPALGKPLVVRVMDRLYRMGMRHFTLIVGDQEGVVASYVKTQWMPDVHINLEIKFDRESALQVLARVASQINAPFIYNHYNCFAHTQYYRSLIHSEASDSLVVGVTRKVLSKAEQRYFAVADGQTITDIVNSPPTDAERLAITGIAICEQTFTEYLKTNSNQSNQHLFGKQFNDLVQAYIQNGGSARIAESAWTLQVDTDADLLTLNHRLLADEPEDAHILSELPTTVRIIPPVRIDPKVSVGHAATIGPYVYLERGSTIGARAIVENAIVLERATIIAQATVRDNIIAPGGPVL